MIKRRVFYSFHYENDFWRAATVRNIGAVEGNRPATDNEWEKVKMGGDQAIERWIDEQMKHRSCTLVLVGSHTAGRRWIDYEIKKSWSEGMGLAGIHIHGLQDQAGRLTSWGRNPFAHFTVTDRNGHVRRLSNVVACVNPPGIHSQERYGWIRKRLSAIVEQAIRTRSEW